MARRARACTHCIDSLPLGANPVFQVHADARILLASQAPGRVAHESGVPFSDRSGRRLREWTGLDGATFYDPRRVAIVPMGFCFPGSGPGGDLPPRPECAPLWRDRFLDQLGRVRLTLVIGSHAQRWHLGGTGRVVHAATRWLEEGGNVVPLPHPSPRNNGWLKRNPWFERDLVPRLQARIASVLAC
ncbi:MAG: uracil-DNA glycosylase family protein [Wenzhouxiangellaceae bacterium]|nr:uracil-DNA glycosylase family protein [Wenzhouxiangellaceae bacterium]